MSSKRSYKQGIKKRARGAPPRQRYMKVSQRRAAQIAQASNARTGGFIGRELKFFDTSFNDQLTSNNDWSGAEVDPATAQCISSPAQGDGEQQRDGRKIVIKSAFVNGVIELPRDVHAQGAEPDSVFVALVLDTQTNGAQLNSEDVYINPGGSHQKVTPLRNLQYTSRFRVLDTARVEFSNTNVYSLPLAVPPETGFSSGMMGTFTLSKKLEVPVTFTGAGSTVSTVMDNSLHIVAISSHDQGCQMHYNARIRFIG